MKEEHPEIRIVDIKKIDLKKSKFICLTPLHCLLTKHKIVELNLGINKIYLPEPIEDFYD